MDNGTTTRKLIFEDDPQFNPKRALSLPWDRTIQMCWSNIQRRAGRFLLIFIGIAVVVAFLMSNLAYQSMVDALKLSTDVHVRAVLERAELFSDAVSLKKQHDQQLWLMILSSILCLVGITNTMLMSVTERIREIGTLKCLGALDGFIIRLFMIESIFIGLVGSLIGALLGYLLMILQVGMVLEFTMILQGNPLETFLKGVPIAIVAGTVLTVLAAVYPTYVAARMKPVDAMRVEV